MQKRLDWPIRLAALPPADARPVGEKWSAGAPAPLPPLLLPLPTRGGRGAADADPAGGIVRALLAGQVPIPVAAVAGAESGPAMYQVPSLRRPRQQYTVIVAA